MNFHNIKQVDLEAQKAAEEAAAKEAADRAAGIVKPEPEPALDIADPSYRVINFSAGPATLPLEVLLVAQAEMLNFAGTGMSIMEMPASRPEIATLAQETEQLLREIMSIPDKYRVIFTAGDSAHHYDAVPLNLHRSGTADYLISGYHAEQAAKSAEKHLTVTQVATNADKGYTYVPAFNPSERADYYHLTPNNPVYGTAINHLPETATPLVADMSSCILSQDYHVEKFGVIYASAQQQLGIAGLGVVIARDNLLGKAKPETPDMYNWASLAKPDNPHTPPVFALYIMNLYLHWVKSNGGLPIMEAQNRTKAELLYRIIDSSPLYKSYASKDARSLMNVTFSCGTPELDAKFIVEAEDKGLVGLKGFKTIGGLRASLYNATSVEDVEALGRFMLAFEERNQ